MRRTPKMTRRSSQCFWLLLALMVLCVVVSSCKAVETVKTVEVEKTEEVVAEETSDEAGAPAAHETESPEPLPTQTFAGTAVAEVQAFTPPDVLARVEIEAPEKMWLGEADTIRISLIPQGDSYQIQADFADHTVQSQPIDIPQPEGYTLVALAWLDAPNFNYAPNIRQEQPFAKGETVSFRWSLSAQSAGRQRLIINVGLRWLPVSGDAAQIMETSLIAQTLQIQIQSILGMRRTTAFLLGGVLLFALLLLGIIMLVIALMRKPRSPLQSPHANPNLVVEPLPGLSMSLEIRQILNTVFNRYQRLIINAEFQSGYSGARTWLAQPIHADGRHDAQTIIKIGSVKTIVQEYENYQHFVKDTLPPITARIQQPPVKTRQGNLAALRYTFIGQSGQPPVSLRQALLADPAPQYFQRLFESFGANWWLQRSPATFRVAVAYDQIMPSHLVMLPSTETATQRLHGTQADFCLDVVNIGDCLRLSGFKHIERRADGESLSIEGEARPGFPPLRIRWMYPQFKEGQVGKVIATRTSLMQAWVKGLPLFSLPDPLPCVDAWLNQSINASHAIIHGDLNLENILIGPNNLVWLIDFARTRYGHPLSDFAHLYGETIAQVIAMQDENAEEFLDKLTHEAYPLLTAIDQIAERLLTNPANRHEYHLSLALTCLGMVKFPNLTPKARHLLYLTAALKGKNLNTP